MAEEKDHTEDVAHPTASVVITTRNRKENTLRAVSSCFAQTYSAIEVLVFDDASEDGTAEAVASAYPKARVFAETRRSGYIVLRNRGFEEARGEIVFSIDDDAYFSARDSVAWVMETFAADDRVAAVAIPFIEPLARRSKSTLDAPLRAVRGSEIRSYIGCAHAIRRKTALDLGGYREFFEHQGEERDLCMRIRETDLKILYCDCAPIVHTVSPARDRTRMVFFGTRNTLLFDLLNLPAGILAYRLPADILSLLRYRFDLKTLPVKTAAIIDAFRVGFRWRKLRRPVSAETWRSWRSLPTHGPDRHEGDPPFPAGCVDD